MALTVLSCSRPDRGHEKAPPSASSAPRLGAATERCRRILLRAWSSIQPGLDKLRVERSPELKARYLGASGAPFLAECVELPTNVRSCLESAASPVIAARECAVDSGASVPEFPSFAADVRLLDPPPLAKEQARKLGSRLVGTWSNRTHDGKTNAVWKFLDSGELEIREYKTSQPDVGRYRIAFPAARRMTLQVAPSTTQSVALLLAADDVLYASRGLGFDPAPFSGRDSFVVRDRDSFIFGESSGCTVVNVAAASTRGKCEFFREAEREWLTVRWSWGRAAHTARYELTAGHLLHERLVELGRFERSAANKSR